MSTPLRVAVADDELIMQMYLAETLRRWGYDVVIVARDGSDLVEQCRRQPIDLLVTDIRMPGLDGVAAALEICRARMIPVLFLTGHEDRDRIRECENGCICAFLAKPVGESELRTALDAVLYRYELYRQRQEGQEADTAES